MEPYILTVWAKPGAKHGAILGWRADATHAQVLVVAINAPPIEGKANVAVVQILAKALGLPKRTVTIISGETSRTKRIAITTDDLPRLTNQLAALPTL